MRKYILILLPILYFACTPKVTEPVVVKEEVKETPPVEKKGPCTTLSELSPTDKDATETAFVLYKDLVKQNNFDEALPLWEKAYYKAPAANGRIKYQFDDGVKMYKYFYANTTDNALKQSYRDSVESIYNKRIECFGDDAYVKGRLGFDLYYYMKEHSSDNEIFKLFKESIDAKGEDMDYFIVNPFAKILFDKAVSEEISKEEAGKYAQIVLRAVKKGMANCVKDCDAWKIVNDYAPPRLENLEGIKGLYPCEYFVDKYYQEYVDNPSDCDVINKVYRKLKYAGCSETQTEFASLIQAKKDNCYVAPPQESTLRQAYNAYESGDYQNAVKYFEEFANSKDDIEKKSKYLFLIAKIYYGEIKNFPKARTYAQKAADIKPNWGEPYILIGKLYASSGPLCGPGTGWDSQVVTWPAIDMFNKAKQVDPSTASEANKWINTYTQYMPKKSDIFQRNIKEGDSFKVACWINRNTTVRTAP